ncbi:MAG: ComF family protein [Deltaproteobacteria bacterium]|nr:ComF family protein [Deltaproteobacteria bacterium]
MLGSIIDILFPPVCPACEKAVRDKGKPLCASCEAGFSAIRIMRPICAVCGEPFISTTSGEHTCGPCLEQTPPFAMARSVYSYAGAALDAIHRFKYSNHLILAPAFADMLLRAVGDMPFPDMDVIVPVPLHAGKLRQRGFNQSLLICRGIAKKLKVDLSYDNLVRAKATLPQVNLKAAERAKNLTGAFALRFAPAFKGKRITIVDDVYTTGATIKECSKVLKKAGAEVYALTLARTVKL